MLILHCERCHERRTFLPIEERPPFDPNTTCCSACGFSFGYRQVETFVSGRLVVETRPVLDPQTAIAGHKAFVAARVEMLKLSGTTPESEHARREFEATAGDPKARRRMTSQGRGSLDPGLAANILRPKVPGPGNRGEG